MKCLIFKFQNNFDLQLGHTVVSHNIIELVVQEAKQEGTQNVDLIII